MKSYATGPESPPVRDITLGALLEEAAASVPDRIALIAGVEDPSRIRQWSYRELHQESLRVAHAVAARFKPGERVAVWAPNVPEWIMLEFGCAMAGVILVTVNPSYQARELEYVLNQSKSAGIVVLEKFRGNPMLDIVQSVRERCPALREIIPLGQWDEFLNSAPEQAQPLPDVQPQDAVMIQYTSGTTGFPKGALLHHRGLVNNGAHTMERMGVRDGSVWLTFMPLFHTGGCVCCVLGSVAKRSTQVLMESFEPGLALELCEAHQVSALIGVPTMLTSLLEHPTFHQRDLSSLVSLCSGGSTVPAALVQRLESELDATFTIVFGQTESSPVSSMTRPDDSTADKANTLGGPMPHVELKIIDPESGETLLLGEPGEYCTRGYHVMNEYFEMPEATAAAIDKEGWLHTGDLCSMDERGYCTVVGRLKDMIIRGGENIYPREIEELLYAHEAVGDVAVVGLPDEKMGEIVSAFIRPAPGHQVDRGVLFRYLRDHLSPQKTPAVWVAVDEFPLTGSGKIQKFRLREMWLSGTLEALA